jgi:hypothetical protein
MIACMEMRLRPARLPPARLRPARLPPARRAGPTTDIRRQTHSRSRGYQSSDGSPVCENTSA